MNIKINETFIFEEKSFFTFFRKLWKKKITTLNVKENTSIKEIKKEILKKYKLDDEVDLFVIKYKDKVLEDNLTLKEINIKENETLFIFCRNKNLLNDKLREKRII